ncbi:enoyl-CoA hydratase/isomerase family protein [Variovorax saccharolyticus]|uniref:enoyl-CoA hydratase/isomerase family protein n=1 Tax=Variovorax saccharolyticus TaxID=3053516 RepID=UPI0025786C0A|nr:enoyl-CoA hydratase-related protein [Variovorax sp. J22R187]MDM0018471.1 enoyl-CoA hydratase-related protein [Variovorax sp. J22R187]
MSGPSCPNDFRHIVLRRRQDVLFATLNRPETRNALAPEVVAELARVLDLAEADDAIRALVLRGSSGFFCAGGNVGSFKARLDADPTQGDDPVAARNREFGRFMQRLAALPLPVIAAVEGAAMGGGMGLACGADIVLATPDARFALSETSLGIIPAQIAPFVVARLGHRVARRLGLSGERINGQTALRLGMVDELAADSAALDELLAQWLSRIGACAPHANRVLKPLLHRCGHEDDAALLDDAARRFAACMRDEGAEGIAAFREKRASAWRREISADEVRAAQAVPAAPAARGTLS